MSVSPDSHPSLKASGVASPSYVANCMGDSSADKLAIAKDQAIMWTAASLYTGGTDTVRVVLPPSL